MKQRHPFNFTVTRRGLLVLASGSFSACGGGGPLMSGPPGTGGTGSTYAQGPISGFGSVIVNGIRFDDTQAAIRVDGSIAASASLRLGMVAGVQGQHDPALLTGTASQIEVWSAAQGQVSAIAGSSFVVAGMTVLTDAKTILDGLASIAQLAPGLRVSVWGLQAGVDGQRWTATRVSATSDATVVSTGVLTFDDDLPYVNGFRLVNLAAANLVVGDLVRVGGQLSSDGKRLSVESQRSMAANAALPAEGEGEIEGLVTAMPTVSRIAVGQFIVDTAVARFKPASAQLALGVRIQVTGTWQSGVLKATEIEIEDEQVRQTLEVKARIEQFVSIGNFVLRGQRCDASTARISHGTAADVRPGQLVEAKGYIDGDVLKVTDLELVRG